MTDKRIIDGKECRYWFRPNPSDYRKCSLRGENDNCDEIKDCFVKELLGKLALKEQECEEVSKQVEILNEKLLHKRAVVEFADCPHYSYGDNTIEPTCTKNFCYDVKSCDHKNMVKYKQALDEIKEICNSVENIENINSLYDAKLSGMFLQANKILQKISECEVHND